MEELNWNFLRYFEEVAKEEHFTRAAENLHRTQSALSKSIDKLEEDLGIPLFERDGRNVRLTRYGQILYRHVAAATAEIEKGLQILQTMSNSEAGEVRFASIFSAGGSFLPSVMKGFQAENPNVRLTFYQKSTHDILQDIADGKIDFGFCGEFRTEETYAQFEKEAIIMEELLLAVPKNHPLARQKSVPFSEITGESFIGWTTNTGIRESIRMTLDRAGIDSRQIKEKYTAAEDNTVLSMVREGLGIALIADNSYINRSDITLLHISNPYFSRTLYLVWKKDVYVSPAAKAFKYYVLSRNRF